MPKIINEVSAPLHSLPWLVARDEGLFAKKGLDIEFVKARLPDGIPRITDDVDAVPSIGPHCPFEEGQAAIYRACHWGQIRRAYDSEVGGRIVGKRPTVSVQAIFSRKGSPLIHPATLKNKTVGVAFHRGSHYAALQLLEGFLKRDEIKLVHIEMVEGYEALVSGEIDAFTIMDPWITLAEKEGHQKIAETHYLGSEIATPEVDERSWALIAEALVEAVALINAAPKKYLHYLIDSLPEKYRGRITADDFHIPRLRFINPEPYTKEEFEQTNDWLISWGLVQPDSNFDRLVDNRIKAQAA